jgi:UDP-MurNAc hydroxylase
MKTTLVGHACLLCEAYGINILMDPNLMPTFREGIFGFCPSRRVDLDRLPAIHVVLLSHRHRDHFDLRSLHLLPRQAFVIHSEDAIIAHALKRLQFANTHVVQPWDKIRLAENLSVIATPSCFSRPGSQEVGFAIVSDAGSVWNLADTALTPDELLFARRVMGAVDVAFYPFQPMLQAELVQNRANSFPVREYAQVLRHLGMMKPRAVVPSSCGYRILGSNDWLNQFKFPVSRKRFAKDVAAVDPGIEVAILDPGDAVHVAGGAVRVERAAAANGFVTATDEASDEAMCFDPVRRVAPLCDTNPRGLAPTEVRARVAQSFERWARAIEDDLAGWELWFHNGLTYEFRIIYPDGVESTGLDFSGAHLHVGPPAFPPADFTLACTADTLLGLIEGRYHFDHQLGGAIRTFTCWYRPSPQGVHDRHELLPEYSEDRLGGFGLLRRLVDPRGEHARRVVDHELDNLLGERNKAMRAEPSS